MIDLGVFFLEKSVSEVLIGYNWEKKGSGKYVLFLLFKKVNNAAFVFLFIILCVINQGGLHDMQVRFHSMEKPGLGDFIENF